MKKKLVVMMCACCMLFGNAVAFGGHDRDQDNTCSCRCKCVCDRGDRGPGDSCSEGPGAMDKREGDREGRRAKFQEKCIKQLSKDLTLTKEQEAGITKIFDDGWAEMEKEKEAMKAKMDAMHESNETKIKALLTDEQKKIFDEKKKQRMEEREKRWKKEKMGKRGDKKQYKKHHKEMED